MSNISYKSYPKSIIILIKTTHLSPKSSQPRSQIQKPKHAHQKSNPKNSIKPNKPNKNQNPLTKKIKPWVSDPTRTRTSNPWNKEKQGSDSGQEDQHNRSETSGRVQTQKQPCRETRGGPVTNG